MSSCCCEPSQKPDQGPTGTRSAGGSRLSRVLSEAETGREGNCRSMWCVWCCRQEGQILLYHCLSYCCAAISSGRGQAPKCPRNHILQYRVLGEQAESSLGKWGCAGYKKLLLLKRAALPPPPLLLTNTLPMWGQRTSCRSWFCPWPYEPQDQSQVVHWDISLA